MCPTNKEKSNWLSNGKRNGIGYEIVPLIAVVALISLIVLSAVSIYLPPLLFISPIIAMAIPAVFAAVTCIALIIAGMYMHRNRDKQVDDRYRLEFGNGPQGRLCLENQKDLGYFEMVLKDTEHKDFPLTSQGDDRYRLEFDNGPQGRLCLDDTKDLGYFEKVLKDTEQEDFPLKSQKVT